MDTQATLPILYSFRRCPFAIRARLSLAYAGIVYRLREVKLANKPTELITVSSKATVPVLVLPDQTVIDESMEIMRYAVSQTDDANWYGNNQQEAIDHWVLRNDTEFKPMLDAYKYPQRYPSKTPLAWREQATVFLQALEQTLLTQPFLLGEQITLADAALFPFIRQFAHVDRHWFLQSPWTNLVRWYHYWQQSELLQHVLQRYPVWQTGATEPVIDYHRPLKTSR